MGIAQSLRRAARRVGFDVVRFSPSEAPDIPVELDDYDRETLAAARPFTMTSVPRLCALINAVKYVARTRIPGDIVECGVWKGGSMVAVARTLRRFSDLRHLYLYDTFEGMPPPTENDKDISGASADHLLKTSSRDSNVWAVAQLDTVKQAMSTTGYDPNLIHYVQGKVEDTIPRTIPQQIALLRLDTDWYESTIHELNHLYPLLAARGVLIIDDYGHWQGAKKAVDEYIASHDLPLLLNTIDYTGRIAVKPA
jgi:hypothetical protein